MPTTRFGTTSRNIPKYSAVPPTAGQPTNVGAVPAHSRMRTATPSRTSVCSVGRGAGAVVNQVPPPSARSRPNHVNSVDCLRVPAFRPHV